MALVPKVIEDAYRLAVGDVDLDHALRDWHQHDGALPTADRGKTFEAWLNDMLCYCSTLLDEAYQGRQTAQQIVYALRINAIGDPLALQFKKEVEAQGFKTDVNCYVEDGMVYAGIWISSASAEESLKKAKEIEQRFKDCGYEADVWIDEEDDRDVTVNATVAFTTHIAHHGRFNILI